MLDYTSTPSLSTQLCQPETLHVAWRKVRANKGGPGSDGVTIQQFEANLTKHLRQLSRELTEERYYPLPVQKFTLKKSNGSTRELSVLTLKDRIVQRAVCDLIAPIYEAKFLDCSFGYRPNRGVPHAIAEAAAIRSEGYGWVVHADIENFFDRMDTQILMRFLRASLKEPLILRLIQMWLDMGGILQPPKLPTWIAHVENTVHSLGEGVEHVTNRLLHRTPQLESYSEYPNVLPENEWALDESDMNTQTGPLTQTGKEFLTNLGRDGLLLLLANAKRFWRPLAAKQLLFIAPVVVAAIAAPTVGSIVKERMSRPRKIGIIQGSPLSPLLANIYLHPFDKAMTRAGIRTNTPLLPIPSQCLELAKGFVRGKLTNAIRFSRRQRSQNPRGEISTGCCTPNFRQVGTCREFRITSRIRRHWHRCPLPRLPAIPHTRLGLHHATIPPATRSD